ncbi:MAG: polysaccharide deacetylase family protein [Polyangiaceae bacterium]
MVPRVDPASYAGEPERFVGGIPCPVPKGMPTWSWGTLVRVEGLEVDAVVLTIDAGLRAPNLLKELDILKEKDVRATVFLYTGELAKRADGPEIVKRILADGHELGNHTRTHRDLTKLSDDEVGAEVDDVESFAQTSAGATTKPYFRAPFLAMNDAVSRVLNQRCYRSVWITLDTRDDRADATSEDIVRAVFEDRGQPRAIERGSILLFHGSQPANLTALPQVIDGLHARGFAILTLSEALRLAKPKPAPKP